MSRITKKKWAGTILAAGLLGWVGYVFVLSPTQVVFVNYPDHMVAEFDAANDSPLIRIHRLSLKDGAAPRLTRYHAIFLFGAGVNLDEAQKARFQAARDKDRKIYADHASSELAALTNLAEEEKKRVEGYLRNGGRQNRTGLLHYVRRNFQGKRLFAATPAEPRVIPEEALCHLDEEAYFETVAAYEKFYRGKGFYKEGAPKVVLFSTNRGPRNSRREHINALILSLEKRNLNVYCVAGFQKNLAFLKDISPDLAVLMPHGRLAPGQADQTIAWLKERNIPVLMALTVNQPYTEWMKDQRGMDGGFLSQSVVMPELDGTIDPFVVAALKKDERGYDVFAPIDRRVEVFADRVQNWFTLKTKSNRDKKIAIIYYKGNGKNALVASGLEVIPSLLNVLRTLNAQGYATGPLPKTSQELQERVYREGPVLGHYAKGSLETLLKEGQPTLVPVADYQSWTKDSLLPEMRAALREQYGPPPGDYLSHEKDGTSYIVLPAVRFGNVVLMPQLGSALGDEEYQLTHGVKRAPPHPYVAAYLWLRKGFKADAIMHFGTHGNYEFMPWKQVALSDTDWPDALMGAMPHAYVYHIGDVGEGVIAKRRSYAVLVSNITPPLTESGFYGELESFHTVFHEYEKTEDKALKEEMRRSIREKSLVLGLHKDLGFEKAEDFDVNEVVVQKLIRHLHTVEWEKITRGLYTLGNPYADGDAVETARLMALDAVAYGLADVDLARERITREQRQNVVLFDHRYRPQAFGMVNDVLLKGKAPASLIAPADLARLHAWEKAKISDLSDPEKEEFRALRDLRDALINLPRYKKALMDSPAAELASVVNVFNGGYIAPSPGGDPIVNPEAVPTGRNLFSIDAERTPTQEAWKVGVKLADQLIEAQVKKNGEFPQKVAMTLWSSEFIRDQGTTIAEVLYLLGVEPVWNARGVAHDVRLIPMDRLQRPRIDVLVQTSGQFRDLAASRIYLIDKAVRLASKADDAGGFENHVKAGSLAAERVMKEKGLSPLQARHFATARVFGGVNGNYGTAIMELVEKGDRWEKESEVARQYLNNMGAVYTQGDWSAFTPGIFEGALQHVDTIVHPRSSTVTGPLNLDHVYEFMGGLALTVRNVTGKDPDGYFSDIRNKHNPVMMGLKQAVWVEARSSLFNPKFIQDHQKGGASSAEFFAETFRNVYGWNVMKPKAIDRELWDTLNDVYIDDKYQLGIKAFFERENPYAFQEMTAVMLETVRKGYWKPDPAVVQKLMNIHAQLIKDHGAGCSGFVCDNAKLRAMIQAALSPELKKTYDKEIAAVRQAAGRSQREGVRLQKEAAPLARIKNTLQDHAALTAGILILVGGFSGLVFFGARRRARYEKP
ncbi:MAG: cobaltochelatase subunit CobN [Verrucomicrobia bacterium]|nr:cobaltochelatase subunit CobN [Verrucomicrobiota bacterium]